MTLQNPPLNNKCYVEQGLHVVLLPETIFRSKKYCVGIVNFTTRLR